MANNLRELTHEQHKRAEKSKFINRLLKGSITPAEYYSYLTEQFYMYSVLEDCAQDQGVFNNIQEVRRATAISKDLQELEKEHGFNPPAKPMKSTTKYVNYIKANRENSKKLLAHIYVRHMGDLSGGQIIKRFVHGSGNMYMFDADVNVLKDKLREKLDDSLAEEAIHCFDMTTEFLEELEASFGNMGTTN